MDTKDIVSPRFRSVVENTFAADADLDAARFVSRLTPDATFQLGGKPAVNGRDAIRAMVVQTFSAFARVEHALRAAYELGDVLVYEAEVNYTFRDGRSLRVPYANVLHFAGDLVGSYRIYLDLSALQP